MNRRTRNRLRIEHLESRDLLAVFRLTAWNTLNSPNDLANDADFSTVLSAIGNETVAGNTKRVDILAIQETDPPGAGGNSIGRIENVLDTLYPTTDYATAISGLDGGGDSTGFVYDTSTVTLLESIDVPGSLTHAIIRGEFRPVDTLGESDFFVYSVHLKSGASGSDEATRGTEAAILRNDADLLGEGAAILIVGDFNMHGSFEAAHTNLTTIGAGQVQDLANAPGNWSDNVAFKSLHTQNPMSTLDDRFDLQFASGEFFDGVGIEYVDDSFHVFGNDGSHTLNAPITTGTGAPPAVLAALVGASDHLPIVADYETIPSVPLVRVRETESNTKVIEGGIYDTYSLVLDTAPTADVTVTLTPDSQIDLGLTTQVVFTPANALTPQTIVVHAFNDLTEEGNHAGLITHAVASADTDYDGISIVSVVVDVVDDEAPTLYLNEIDSDTPGFDALEFIELYDGGVGNTSLTGKTIALFNGATDEVYRTFSLTGYATDNSGYFVVGNSNVTNVDFSVFNTEFIQNGADAVALYAGSISPGDPITTVNLLDALVYDTNDADDLGLLALLQAGQPQINENENGNKDFDSLSRVPDGGFTRQTDGFVAQLPTPGEPNSPPAAGVLLLQSGTRIDVEEGGSGDSYQLALDTIPVQPVVITVDPDDQTDIGLGAGVPIVLHFTVANALIPQTINVTAVDDALLEGDHASVITHTATSSDLSYDGLTIGNVVASVLDNEVQVAPSIVISEIMYNPESEESEPGIAEWIEIVNTGSTTIDLGDWRFDDEDAASWGVIPQGTLLAPGKAALFFDEEFTDVATFKSEWSLPGPTQVIGIQWGSLANSPSTTNEILELFDNLGMQQDMVNYDDSGDWPSDSPDGASIYLTDLLADNNLGTNWAASVLGKNNALSPSGSTFSSGDIGSPGFTSNSTDFDGDGDIDGSDFLAWQRGFGMLSAGKAEGDANNDTQVDAVDLAIWETAYGNDIAPAIVSPEQENGHSNDLAAAFGSVVRDFQVVPEEDFVPTEQTVIEVIDRAMADLAQVANSRSDYNAFGAAKVRRDREVGGLLDEQLEMQIKDFFESSSSNDLLNDRWMSNCQ